MFMSRSLGCTIALACNIRHVLIWPLYLSGMKSSETSNGNVWEKFLGDFHSRNFIHEWTILF